MLQPARQKYRKQQKGRMKGKAMSGNRLSFGEYGLKAMTCGRITARQIEAGRVAISRHAKRGGKIWIRMFPDKPITKKPLETRMGKGKGAPEYFVMVVKPGRILYEIAGTNKEIATRALKLAAAKLPIRTKVVSRENIL